MFVDSSRSRVSTDDRNKFLDERLHPKVTNCAADPKEPVAVSSQTSGSRWTPTLANLVEGIRVRRELSLAGVEILVAEDERRAAEYLRQGLV